MSIVNTRIQNTRENSNLDKNELRPSRYGGLNLFMAQTNAPGGILTPEIITKAESSIGSTLETPVIDFDGTITIGNTRTATIADSENTSRMYAISFATYAWGFTSVPSLFMNNEISMQADFERKFNKYLYKLGEVLDAAAISALAAAKSQVFADLLTYSNVGNAVITPWRMRENIIGDINPIMAANDHFGGINLVGNGGLESIINKLAQKAVYNESNQTLQYADKMLYYTPRIANATGEFANLYAVMDGSVGILTRFEREALLGTETADGHAWGIDTLPMLNFPIGTYYYESVGDFNAIAGAASADMTRARKEHFGFAIDVAFVTPFNSAPSTIANPIMKYTIMSETDADKLQIIVANPVTNPVNTQEVSAS